MKTEVTHIIKIEMSREEINALLEAAESLNTLPLEMKDELTAIENLIQVIIART